jgi:hypothetical protein
VLGSSGSMPRAMRSTRSSGQWSATSEGRAHGPTCPVQPVQVQVGSRLRTPGLKRLRWPGPYLDAPDVRVRSALALAVGAAARASVEVGTRWAAADAQLHRLSLRVARSRVASLAGGYAVDRGGARWRRCGGSGGGSAGLNLPAGTVRPVREALHMAAESASDHEDPCSTRSHAASRRSCSRLGRRSAAQRHTSCAV